VEFLWHQWRCWRRPDAKLCTAWRLLVLCSRAVPGALLEGDLTPDKVVVAALVCWPAGWCSVRR
jgi:hypothetical protein